MLSKFKIKVFIIPFFSLCFSLLALMSLYAQANITLSIDADKVVSNSTTKRTAYSGNVIIHYGNNQLLTPEMIIYKDDEDKFILLANGTKDDRVKYKNTSNKPINITALNVNYSDKDKIFVFSGQVVVVTADSRLEGDKVLYDVKSGKITSHANDNKRVSTQFNLN